MITLKHLIFGAALALTLTLNAETVRADTVELFIQNNACFACTVAGPFFPTVSFRELAFTGSTFGTLISSPPTPPFDVSLGTFTLGRAEEVFVTNFILRFVMRPEFDPTGGFSSSFSATVSGGGGAAFFDFDNRPVRFFFAISGIPPEPFSRLLDFTIEINDVTVGEGGQAQLTARITPLRVINPPQAVPEPATLTLPVTGLIGARLLSRPRRKSG